MKKLICLFLSVLMLMAFVACKDTGATNEQADNGASQGENGPNVREETPVTDEEIAHLESLYAGLTMHHGQLHDHANTGRRSDGKATLTEWKEGMPAVGMEYVALLDHRQTDHLYLPEWDPTLFISGSEAMTYVNDRPEEYNKYHYNMIFPSVVEMEEHLTEFRMEYMFGNGVFDYNPMTSAKFTEVIKSVLDKGGYFVIPHPAQTAPEICDDPMQYYFCDGIGYEVFYHISENESARDQQTQNNYKIWTGMLANGAKVYCSSGSDVHNLPTNRGLSTIYSSEKLDTSYIEQLRKGNYTAGPVGVRMTIGETTMGGTGTFAGQRVVVAVGDFHSDFAIAGHTYRIDIVSDTGLVYSASVDPSQMNYFAIDADENAKFYRVEIHDEANNYSLLALGNPIWNAEA